MVRKINVIFFKVFLRGPWVKSLVMKVCGLTKYIKIYIKSETTIWDNPLCLLISLLKKIIKKYNVINPYVVESVCSHYLYAQFRNTVMWPILRTLSLNWATFRNLVFSCSNCRFLLSPSLLYNVIYRMQNTSDSVYIIIVIWLDTMAGTKNMPNIGPLPLYYRSLVDFVCYTVLTLSEEYSIDSIGKR